MLSFKDEVSTIISLPVLYNTYNMDSHFITWKINVKEILSKDCFIKFVISEGKDVGFTFFFGFWCRSCRSI